MARKYHQKRNKKWKELAVASMEHTHTKISSNTEVQTLLIAKMEVKLALLFK